MTPRTTGVPRRVALALPALGALAACGGSTEVPGETPFVLRIQTDAGEKVKLPGVEGRSETLEAGLTVTLTQIDGERMTITTSDPVTSDDGAEVTELDLAKGEPVTFETEDGVGVTVTYEEISVE